MHKHAGTVRYLLYIPLLLNSAFAQGLDGSAPDAPARYALILEHAPLGRQVLHGTTPRAALATPLAKTQRHNLLRTQDGLRSALRSRNIATTGAVQTLLNAVFVTATRDQIAELNALPGVTAVVPMRSLRRSLNRALDIVNANAAWSAAGGPSNAGAGIKIAVLDTGIDETHPGLKDSLLSTPAGYPKYGNADDATHATTKVIAVRSFVSRMAIGDGAPELSRPDDLSARDRVGHGTAVAMIAAGAAHDSPLGAISGIAPKAWLGNYKIFGSPGVIDFTTADVVLEALEAAFNDGMDVAILSAGNVAATWSSEDRGGTCNNEDGAACDPWAAALMTATLGGMTVVVPAGNSGAYGPNTIDTPGHVPAAITVGATTNARALAPVASTPDGGRIPMRFGDGPKPSSALTAPLKTIDAIDSTEHACLPLRQGSLAGSVALIARGALVTRGNCGFATKVGNAQAAGALAVLIFREPGDSSLFEPTGLSNTGVPAALISAESGSFLKTYLANHPGGTLTLDPAVVEVTATEETVADFSGRGPGISGGAIKPELVAPGAGLYTAAQNYDPNGDLYSPDRYIGVDGTSFAAAVVGGAVALVKQSHPDYTPAQLKSAVTNTAAGIPAGVNSAGAGRLNVQAAMGATVTAEPATAAFGILKNLPIARTLTLTNTGKGTITLQLTVNPREPDARASVRVNPSSLSLDPGKSGSVTVALTGAMPSPGSYEGFITVTGGAAPMRIPYLYIAGEGVPRTLVPLKGDDFVTEVGTAVHVAFKAVDRYGAPVPAMQVRFAPTGSIYAATPATDEKGIAEAYLYGSTERGEQSFLAQLQGGGGIEFKGRTRIRPQIKENGVRDAASSRIPDGFAPGSYISIFGSGLSESTAVFRTPYLPLSLAGVSVSFDVPSAGVHAPGRLSYVSDTQINVQIPWELAGATSAIMKVTLSNSASCNVRSDNSRLETFRTQMITLPIAPSAPAFFEYQETPSGPTLAAALDEQYRVLTSGNPARPGHVIQFFMNGLGDVIDGARPGSGEITPTAPLAATRVTPIVTIGGLPAQVLFSGLAPANIGLYQVNVVAPNGLAAGIQPVDFSIGGIASKTSVVVQ
jgi:minor extracellular serine protease Vpr